jgi:hypothetical protein
MADHCCAECHFAECRYDECLVLFIIMRKVVMLSVAAPAHALSKKPTLSITTLSISIKILHFTYDALHNDTRCYIPHNDAQHNDTT